MIGPHPRSVAFRVVLPGVPNCRPERYRPDRANAQRDRLIAQNGRELAQSLLAFLDAVRGHWPRQAPAPVV